MEAVNERQQDAKDHQQNETITSRNRTKGTTNTGEPQVGRHGVVNDGTKVKINEELDGDYEDLEQSHEKTTCTEIDTKEDQRAFPTSGLPQKSMLLSGARHPKCRKNHST